MKLKFKATAKDWLIFVLFVIVLFYFISILVANIYTIVRGIGFAGLSPFAVFKYGQFGTAFLFFLLALVGIILGVKSYFFEKEKGLCKHYS